MWHNARRNTWQKCNNVSINNVQIKLVGCLKYIQLIIIIIIIILTINNDDDKATTVTTSKTSAKNE